MARRSWMSLVMLAPLALALALQTSCATTPRSYSAAAPGTADAAAYFYDDLAPYGDWYWTDAYGWVWQPRGVPAGWRPYSYGSWAYSDYGWTWRSYWDWGWAPFHYGRWASLGGRGWAWVPGSTWGPAWVAWRSGPGYVGWAPLPPSAHWVPGRGVVFAGGGLGLGSHAWVFVQPRYLTSRNVASYALPPGRYGTYLRQTRPIVRYGTGRQGVIHRGIEVEQVERAMGRPVPRAQVVERQRPPRPSREGLRRTTDRIEVFRPEELRRPLAQRQRPEVQSPGMRSRPDDELRPPGAMPRRVAPLDSPRRPGELRPRRDPGAPDRGMGRPYLRDDDRQPRREAFRDSGRVRPPRSAPPPRSQPPGGGARPARPDRN